MLYSFAFGVESLLSIAIAESTNLRLRFVRLTLTYGISSLQKGAEPGGDTV